MMHLQKQIAFIKAAVECSVYLAPTDPGLTYPELLKACARAGYQAGEVNDAFRHTGIQRFFGAASRLSPDSQTTTWWGVFHLLEDPEYRNLAAFDFVVGELNDLAKAVSMAGARIERRVLVERAAGSGLPRQDTEAAITIMIMSERLTERDGVLSMTQKGAGRGLPSAEQDAVVGPRTVRSREDRRQAYPIVRDIIGRRTAGRPLSAEPLNAFEDELEKLGYGHFRLWWAQIQAEQQRMDSQTSPTSVVVLSAALVEGALTFVAKHGRGLNIGMFGSTHFAGPPRNWRLENLVSGATAGGDAAILDQPSRARVDALLKTRQRIHAGRMLTDHPRGVPDLRPEEAREARETADHIVRRIVDWLHSYPPTAP